MFGLAGLIPSERPDVDSITERAIGWNYTTFLNIVFLGIAAVLVGLTLRHGARDPVCGMTVDRKTAALERVERDDVLLLRARLQGALRGRSRALRRQGAQAREHAHQH